VELLVVITVIVILVSILGVVLANMGQQAKETATNATIKKIHVLLEQRTEAFDRAMNQIKKNDPGYISVENAVINEMRSQNIRLSRSNPPQAKMLEILVRKRFRRSNFPQRFAEAGRITAPAGHVAETESAEVLYFMLTQSEVGGAAPVDAGEFLASEVGDTDGDGLMEFLDAWGNPLRFYRWPTRLFKNNGTTHSGDTAGLLVQGLPAHSANDLLDTDPDDPLEQLGSLITALSTKPKKFEDLYHTPYTYHIPLVVSAGPDGELGMGEPYSPTLAHRLGQVTDVSVITDNITNRNQRSGD
jgi:type II secretory pathway pseudopilin PulG